jgi:hypothetical protein
MRFNAFKYYAMLFKGLTTAGQKVQLSQKMLLTPMHVKDSESLSHCLPVFFSGL